MLSAVGIGHQNFKKEAVTTTSENTWYYRSGSGAMVNKDTRINGVLHRFDHNGGWLGTN